MKRETCLAFLFLPFALGASYYVGEDGRSLLKDTGAVPARTSSVSHPAFPEYLVRLTEPDAAVCDPSVKQYSGYLDVKQDKHFFFWFFESRNDPANDPVILWLNGGPGCSSMTGLFLELGPCLINPDGDGTTLNPHSWNNNASVIFLDQPLNVGYSHGEATEEVHDSEAAARDVYAFLQLFFTKFPQYRDRDFHLSGESYAGHYVPAIGSVVAQKNEEAKDPPINLKSLMIGNGLTDPLTQYQYYGKMACQNDYGAALDMETCEQMDAQYPKCQALIEQCYQTPNDTAACTMAGAECNQIFLTPFYGTSGRDPYDIRKTCDDIDNSLCDDKMLGLEQYLNRPDVKTAVGVDELGLPVDYANCNLRINYQFSKAGDWMRPYVRKLPPLLESGIRIMIYAGDADFICNWMGNKAWVTEMPWSGHAEFHAAPDRPWSVNNEPAGELRSTKDGRLAFLRVYGAGHMVPEDQPLHALRFVNGWIHGGLVD